MNGMKLITTIDSSLSVSYVSSWGFAQAFREFYANAVDAVTDGATLVKDKLWKPSDMPGFGTAKIETVGQTLSRSSLMLGVTKKNEDGRKYIGRHGEGYKVASGVLLRLGHDVYISTGNEVWVPKIKRMEQYDWAEGISWEIYQSKKTVNGVRVEITNVEKGDFDAAVLRCIQLSSGKNGPKAIKLPYYGSILLDEKYRGKLFSHGIYVCEIEDLTSGRCSYGYDLNEVPLNRDRDVPSLYDVAYNISSILKDAVSSGSIRAKTIYDAINPPDENGDRRQTAEGKILEDAYHAKGTFSKMMAAEFLRRNKGCIPVTRGSIDPEKAYTLTGLGVRWSEVSSALMKIIAGEFLSVKDLINGSKTETVTRVIGQTKGTVALHKFILESVPYKYRSSVSESSLSIAELREGVIAYNNGRDVFVSEQYWKSASTGEKAVTLCHEFAHRYGNDISISHVEVLQAMLEGVINRLCDLGGISIDEDGQ